MKSAFIFLGIFIFLVIGCKDYPDIYKITGVELFAFDLHNDGENRFIITDYNKKDTNEYAVIILKLKRTFIEKNPNKYCPYNGCGGCDEKIDEIDFSNKIDSNFVEFNEKVTESIEWKQGQHGDINRKTAFFISLDDFRNDFNKGKNQASPLKQVGEVYFFINKSALKKDLISTKKTRLKMKLNNHLVYWSNDLKL